MKPEGKKLLALLAVALLVLCVAGWVIDQMFFQTDFINGAYFIGTPRLPVPPRATNARTYFDSTGMSRTVEFETDLSREELRQFYETRMANAGWRLEYTYTEEGHQGPGDCLSLDLYGRELILSFRKGSDPTKVHNAGVSVFLVGEMEKRKVELHE